eukprot:TRINITY_DN54475_c0_g1_i1.p1 TRINITY_DN54475_c0_g1~~TRINITY_DN54475_c0_g1_i1.p1  ORF type:complete len:534 (-),score=83.64 TRINITY_DN54475_c0_g1_i1:8-1609(-)
MLCASARCSLRAATSLTYSPCRPSMHQCCDDAHNLRVALLRTDASGRACSSRCSAPLDRGDQAPLRPVARTSLQKPARTLPVSHLKLLSPMRAALRARHAASASSSSAATQEQRGASHFATATSFDGRGPAMRVTMLGAATNVGLAVTKYGAGVLTGSSALVADAAHSLSDLLSDVLTLFVVDAARVPPDEDHPYGHGRFEAIGSLTVAAVLVGTGGGVGWSSASVIAEWWTCGELANGLATSGYGAVALAACLASLVAKEALYHATVRVGRQIGSQTLIANAWHHRTDALSSVAALVGVGGGLLGMPLLDPAAGLVVAALVAKAGVDIGLEAVEEVTEKAVIDDEARRAVEVAAQNIDGVVSIDRLRTRKMGPYSCVDVRVLVDPIISVSAARNVAEHLRNEVHRMQSSVSDVLVHVTPYKQLPVVAGSDTLLRPYTELEREVRSALRDVNEIIRVPSVVTHYVPGRGIRLHVMICCDVNVTVHQAQRIAHEARGRLEKVPDVFSIDFALDLSHARAEGPEGSGGLDANQML